jgi:hypothetical protein
MISGWFIVFYDLISLDLQDQTNNHEKFTFNIISTWNISQCRKSEAPCKITNRIRDLRRR